jgi:ribosomal-protein-alanine N-acetyltransferase
MLARDAATGATVGFSLSRTVAGESELLLLAVLPDHHRRGIGGRLLEDFMNRARDQGASRVHLEVRDGNPAVEMYRAAGFQPVGRRRNYYHGSDGRRFDALTLLQEL